MREPEEMAYYAIRDEKNLPRVVHGVKALAPENAMWITAEEAAQISAAYRSERVKKSKADPEGLTAIVLNEAKEQIVAVVNEANRERDEAFTVLMNQVSGIEGLGPRVQQIENFIAALAGKAADTLEKGQ